MGYIEPCKYKITTQDCDLKMTSMKDHRDGLVLNVVTPLLALSHPFRMNTSPTCFSTSSSFGSGFGSLHASGRSVSMVVVSSSSINVISTTTSSSSSLLLPLSFSSSSSSDDELELSSLGRCSCFSTYLLITWKI